MITYCRCTKCVYVIHIYTLRLLFLASVYDNMADHETKELLNKLNCSEYIQVFNDNDVDFKTLILLKESQIITLVPSIGKQARILAAVKKLKSENSEKEIEIEGKEEEKEKENVKPSTSKRDKCNLFRQNTDIGLPLLKRLRSGVDNLDLENLLQSSCSGQAILNDYRSNNILSHRSRNSLTNLIIYHYLDKSITLSNCEIEILATKIVDLFPNETVPTYYVAPTKICINGVFKSGIAKGKLIDKHRNVLRELKKVGLFKKSEKFERIDKTRQDKGIDKNSDNSYLWLYNNTEPFTDVVNHWNKTYDLRQNSNSTSVQDFLNEWPILYHTKAYSLIECDFTIKYPESIMSMFKNFEKFMSAVKKYLPKKSGPNSLRLILEALENPLRTDFQKDLANFQLLSFIAPQKGIVKGKGKWKPTVVESQAGFISEVKIPGEVDNVIRERRNFCSTKNLTLQPFVVAVSDDNCPRCYVVIEDIRYEFSNLRKGVDICFKIFQTLNARYPIECQEVWYLIQKGLYNITTEYDTPSPNVLTILKSIHSEIFNS